MTQHRIKSIPCVHLPVTDVERSVAWWTEHFGVAVYEHVPGSGKAELRVENLQWIFMHETNEVRQPSDFTRGNMNNSDNAQVYLMTLEVHDVHGLHEQLQASGVRVGPLYEKFGTAFDVYDPDDHKFNIWGGEWVEA